MSFLKTLKKYNETALGYIIGSIFVYFFFVVALVDPTRIIPPLEALSKRFTSIVLLGNRITLPNGVWIFVFLLFTYAILSFLDGTVENSREPGQGTGKDYLEKHGVK